MGRNAVQTLMTNGKVVVQITLRVWISFNISTESSFREKKETKNVETNILISTPLIFLNLENRNILIVLHTKIPKLTDKKNIDIVPKVLQENDVTLKAISISLRWHLKCWQLFLKRIRERLLNVTTVPRYWFKLTGIVMI